MDWLQDVRIERSDPQDEHEGKEDISERHQLRNVGMIRPTPARTNPLVHGDRDVPAVERQHRHEVDDADEEVDECEKYEQRRQAETVELGSQLHGTEDRHDLAARGTAARAGATTARAGAGAPFGRTGAGAAGRNDLVAEGAETAQGEEATESGERRVKERPELARRTRHRSERPVGRLARYGELDAYLTFGVVLDHAGHAGGDRRRRRRDGEVDQMAAATHDHLQGPAHAFRDDRAERRESRCRPPVHRDEHVAGPDPCKLRGGGMVVEVEKARHRRSARHLSAEESKHRPEQHEREEEAVLYNLMTPGVPNSLTHSARRICIAPSADGCVSCRNALTECAAAFKPPKRATLLEA